MAAQYGRQLVGGMLRPLARWTAQPVTALQGNAARLLSAITQPREDGATANPAFGSSGFISSVAVIGTAASAYLFTTSARADAAKQDPPKAAEDEYKRPASKGLPSEIVLYQYEVCPFCCKVKAVLDFHKLPYKVIEVNPLTKAELKWSSYKKVPVVQLDGEVVVGSSTIVSRVAAEVEAAASSKPKAKQVAKGVAKGASLEDETKWRKWVDERFVKILTANIYRSWDESWDTFKYITEQTNWSWGTREVARMSGAVLMWQVGKRMPKKYEIEGDLREALYKACNEFIDAVGPSRPFMGGAKPDLSDLAVYGVLKAVEKTSTFTDAMAHSRIAPWFARVTEAVGSSGRTSTEGSSWSLASKK